MVDQKEERAGNPDGLVPCDHLAYLRFREWEGHEGYIFVERIEVKPNARGKGSGRFLVETLRREFPQFAIAGNIMDYSKNSADIALRFWIAAGAIDRDSYEPLILKKEQRNDTSRDNYGNIIPCWTAQFVVMFVSFVAHPECHPDCPWHV